MRGLPYFVRSYGGGPQISDHEDSSCVAQQIWGRDMSNAVPRDSVLPLDKVLKENQPNRSVRRYGWLFGVTGIFILASVVLFPSLPAAANTIAYQYQGPGCSFGCSAIGAANGAPVDLTIYLPSGIAVGTDVQLDASDFSSPGYTLNIGSYHNTNTDYASFSGHLTSSGDTFVSSSGGDFMHPTGVGLSFVASNQTIEQALTTTGSFLVFGASDTGWGITKFQCDPSPCPGTDRDPGQTFTINQSIIAGGTSPNSNATFNRLPSSLFTASQKANFGIAALGLKAASYALSFHSLLEDLAGGAQKVATSLLDVAGVVAQSPLVVQTLSRQLGTTTEFTVGVGGIATACFGAFATIEIPGADAVTASGCVLAALAFGADIFETGFELAQNDPPDPNFTSVFVPTVSPPSGQQYCTDLGSAITHAPATMDQALSWLNALIVTANRYSTALAANDPVSAGLQYSAFQQDYASYSQAAQDSNVSLSCIASLAEQEGIGITPPSLGDRQGVLDLLATDPTASGFLEDFLDPLGFSPSDTASIVQQVISDPPPLADGTPTQNLLALASSFDRTSSPVPEPPSIFLFIPVLILLGWLFEQRRVSAHLNKR